MMIFDLAALRHSAGLSQSGVATISGVSRQQLSRLENGRGDLRILAKVVGALGGAMPDIRSVRLRNNVSMSELGRRVGVRHSTLSRMEHKGRGSVTTWQRALAALGATIDLTPSEPTWSTPAHITGAVVTAFGVERFCLDPASPDPPTTPCRHWFTKQIDGLAHRWHAELVYVNPPYAAGELQKWIAKAIDEFEAGHARKLVLALPARLETVGMRRLRDAGAAMLLLHQRLKFGGRDDVAPWASVVCTLGATDGEVAKLAEMLPANHRIG